MTTSILAAANEGSPLIGFIVIGLVIYAICCIHNSACNK